MHTQLPVRHAHATPPPPRARPVKPQELHDLGSLLFEEGVFPLLDGADTLAAALKSLGNRCTAALKGASLRGLLTCGAGAVCVLWCGRAGAAAGARVWNAGEYGTQEPSLDLVPKTITHIS